MKNTADVTGGKPIAVLLQSISGVSAINPLVAIYDIYGGKREVLFFYFVPDTLCCYVKNTNDPPRLRTDAILILKYLSTYYVCYIIKEGRFIPSS
jgi:hypothetical protein